MYNLASTDYVGISFWLVSAAMLAATAFFFLERSSVNGKWKTSLTVAGLVTGIAFWHYLYMRGMWIETGTSPTVYRYVDWLLTVPLQVVEFYLILAAVTTVRGGVFFKLLISSLVMLIAGYLGEAGLAPVLPAFVIGCAAWLYIIYEIFAGETSASLAEVFMDLSRYLDKEATTRAQIISALVYPVILFIVSLAVIYALLSFVLPQVVEQFISSNVELPILTQTLLSFSDIFPYILLLMGITVGSIYLIQITKFISNQLKLKLSKFFLHIPLFGEIILFDQTARFCSSMRLMTKAGLNTIDSLRIAQDTFKNLYLKNEVNIVVNKVVSGTSISKAFAQSNIFPEVFLQLISSGDMGSQVSEMFEKTKDFLDQEVDTRRGVLLTLLQPIVILTMGVFVMLIVLSIMLPLLQMNNLIFTI